MVGFALHMLAATLALAYAYAIFRSEFVRSGLQFVAPLLVILIVHVAWIVGTGRTASGYARMGLRRTAQTAIGLAGSIFVVEALAPLPTEAAGGENVLGGILMVLACLVVLAVVIALIALAIYAVYWVIARLVRFGRKEEGDGGGNVNDAGALTLVILLLGAMSAEGLPGTYSFSGRGEAAANQRVDASASDVWAAMGTATSPSYPLPAILHSLPRPVAVTVDEGVTLGANRVVRIAGREGTGDLSMRVTERTATRTQLTVLSDTSPMSNWVAFRTIAYEVLSYPDGIEIEVTLEYESLLAPAWVFVPLVDGAAYLAAGVLARDVKNRAEMGRRL